jgi:2'-5' RNA ligase
LPKTTRTFVALPIPEPIVGKLTRLQESLAGQIGGIRWVNPSLLHVTLNFLGDVVDTDLHLIGKAVGSVAAGSPAFDVGLQGIGVFPDPRRPRVLWAGIQDGHDSLATLHREVARELAAIGYHSEEPKFHPHITLGRIKLDRGVSLDLAPLIDSKRAWSGGTFRARELVVFGSTLGPGGPIYSPLSRASLRGRINGPNA